MTMHQRKAAFLFAVFFAPFLSDVYGVEPIGSASAAIDDCEGKVSPIVWNETISRHAEVPYYNSWDWFDDFGGDEEEGGRGGKVPAANAAVHGRDGKAHGSGTRGARAAEAREPERRTEGHLQGEGPLGPDATALGFG